MRETLQSRKAINARIDAMMPTIGRLNKLSEERLNGELIFQPNGAQVAITYDDHVLDESATSHAFIEQLADQDDEFLFMYAYSLHRMATAMFKCGYTAGKNHIRASFRALMEEE